MKPADREEWILNYLKVRSANGTRYFVDMVHSSFVDDYAEATEAKLGYVMIGAHKCPQLGEDLSRMFRKDLLRRHVSGIYGMGKYSGFPTWVYSYSLP